MGLYDNLSTQEDVDKKLISILTIEEDPPPRKSIYEGLATQANPSPRTSSSVRSIKLSDQLDPDVEARAFKLSQEKNISMPLARNMVKFGKGLEFPSHNQLNSKATRKYLRNAPSDAAISREDINNGNLVKVEAAANFDNRKIYNVDGSDPIADNDPFDLERLKKDEEGDISLNAKMQRALKVGRHNLKLGNKSYQQIWDETPEREIEIRQIEANEPELIEGDNILEDVAIVSTTMEPLIEQSFVKGQERAVLFAGSFAAWAVALGQVPPFTVTPEEALTVPGAAALGYGVGIRIGAAETIFKQEAGLFYREALNIRDVNGKPINKNALKAASLGYAAIATVLEMISLKYLVQTFPGGEKMLGRITKPVVKKMLKNPSLVKRLATIGVKLGTAISVNAAEEFSQDLASSLSEALVQHYAQNKEGLYFMPFDWENAFKKAGHAGTQGALGGAGWGGIGSVVSLAQVPFNVTRSNKFHQKFDDVQENINNTKTKERSEAHAEKLLKSTDLDTEAFVDGKALFQEDEERAKAILIKIDVDPIKAKEQSLIGQDTKIDLALLHSKKLTQEEIDFVQKYLKPAPDSYTKKQLEDKAAVEEMNLLVERWEEQGVEEKKFRTQLDNIKGQIQKAGFEETFAQTNIDTLERVANSFALQGSDRVAFVEKFEIKKTRFKKFKESHVLDRLNIKTDPKGVLVVKKDETGLYNEKFIINLFEKADESTVVHELLGHVFLEEMDVIGKQEGISEQFKKDVASVYKFLDAKEGAILSPVQSEKFARAYEQFLREGRAPTVELSTVFARFKNWLKNIYSSASALNVKLTPEIRRVFNRLIDAENETRTAAALNNIIALTSKQMDALGIIPEKQINMRRLVEQSMQKSERALANSRQKAVDTNKDRLRTEAEKEIIAEDVNEIYDTIDIIIDEGLQFDREEYNEFVGDQNGYKKLPSRQITKVNGRSLEEVAYIFGFEDADTFVGALTEKPSKKVAIERRLNKKIIELENKFNAENFITTKEYLDYLSILGNELSINKEADLQAIDEGIKKNMARWKKEATKEIKVEFPKLKGESLESLISDRTKEKIRTYQKNKVKPKIISRERIKKFAQQTIDATNVVDAKRPDLYLAAYKRAYIAQTKAIIKKDWATALKENEKARLNHEMARLASKNIKLVDKIIDRSKRSAKSKTIINNHAEQIRAIVQRYKMSRVIAPNRPGNLTPLTELFAFQQHIDGFAASDFLINPKHADFAKRYQTLRLEQFKEVDRAIKYLTKIGRQEFNQLLSDGVTKLDDVVIPSVAEMQTRPFKENKDQFDMFAGLSDASRRAMSQLMGMDYMIKMLGGTSLATGELSVLELNTTERLKDGADAQERLYRQKTEEIKDATNQIMKSQIKLMKSKIPYVSAFTEQLRKSGAPIPEVIFTEKKLRAEGVPTPVILQNKGKQKDYFTAEQIFAMAGHRGSQSNINALLSGYPGLTLEQVDILLDKFLTLEDMRAIQKIRDINETLKKPTDEVFLKMKNYDMGTIEAQPYVFKGEKFRGGFWHIDIDMNLALNTGFLSKVEIKTALEKHDSKYQTPYSDAGHTNERKKHKLPISLSLAGVYRHYNKATRYITQAEIVRDVDRIITDDRFKAAAIDAMGKEKYLELRPALKNYANPSLEGYDVPGNNVLQAMRQMATAAHLSLKAIVAPKQLGSISGAIHDLGLRKGAAHGFSAYMKGVTYVMAGPARAHNMMIEKSSRMRNRMNKFDRELLRPKFSKMKPSKRALIFGNREIKWLDAVDLGYMHIKAFDTIAVDPVWWGAYLDEINETGTNDKQAIRYADNIIQGSQPNVDPLTLIPWLRKGGFYNLFNLHQTFTTNIYGQRQRAYWGEWRAGKISTVQYAWFNFMDGFVPIMGIQIMVALLRGRDLRDRETWFQIAEGFVVQWLTMGLPVVSSLAGALTQGWRDVIEIPGVEVVDDIVEMLRNIGKAADGMDEEESKRLLFSILNVASDFAKVPVGPLLERAIKEPEFRGKIFGTDFDVKKKQRKTRRRRR